MKIDLKITQTQKLAMTQEMRQAIEILQLTANELNSLIDQEVLENPILEFHDNLIKEEISLVKEEEKLGKKDDIQWDDYFRHAENQSRGKQQTIAKDEKDEFGFENFSYRENTLHQYLHFQFSMVAQKLSNQERLVGDYLIDCIDDNGYLIADLEYVLENLDITKEFFDEIVAIIQTLDPEGVGARSIEECLTIQLLNRGYEKNSVYLKLVNVYLKELADHRYQKIARETGLSNQEICQFKNIIRTLEPKPGREFSACESVSYVIPDGSIKIINDALEVKINDVSAPKLHLNGYYQKLLKQTKQNEEAKAYLENKMNSAVFLIKSIEQRRQTIKKVIEAVAFFQQDFFFNGNQGLKALTLKDIADEIEMHESTVSRAVRGKYVETPSGTLPLKFFFKRGFSDGNEDRSSEVIKNLICKLIDAEDKQKPLSDQKIVELLKEENLFVARRTIAKYREAMMIASSTRRKDYS